MTDEDEDGRTDGRTDRMAYSRQLDDNDERDDEDDDNDVRNLDPTRHTNSDALKAHIITFEVTILRLNCNWHKKKLKTKTNILSPLKL